MSGKTLKGRNRREVPEWAKEGQHVTVITAEGNRKGVVVKELSSALYVSHREDSTLDLGTFSLASQDDQPEGTLAERGHNGIYKSFTRSRIERVPGASGDAPISLEASNALGNLLRLIPNNQLTAILENLLKLVPRGDMSEGSGDWIIRDMDILSVEGEIRRLSAT